MTSDISTLDFAAFDTETTGLSPHSETLVEIAAVRFNLESGAKEYFQSLVNPLRPIPAQATNVHGITDEMVAGAPTLEKVLPAFFQFLGNSIPVAHNAPFDIGFLSLHSLRHGLTPPDVPVLDSCMFSRRVFLDQPSHSLQNLVQSLSLGESTFHRALADARSCMELFRAIVAKSCGPKASWEQLQARHGKLLSFLDGSRPLEKNQKEEGLSRLFQALEEKRPVWILYEGGYGAREVTPHLLYARGAQRYMEATCHLDGIRKSFRLDRIRGVYDQAQAAKGVLR
ncbi:MAG TPA: exonuclease domain-containing protein [Bdellovibrionota bacterium]